MAGKRARINESRSRIGTPPSLAEPPPVQNGRSSGPKSSRPGSRLGSGLGGGVGVWAGTYGAGLGSGFGAGLGAPTSIGAGLFGSNDSPKDFTPPGAVVGGGLDGPPNAGDN